jgi:hypothetical protein
MCDDQFTDRQTVAILVVAAFLFLLAVGGIVAAALYFVLTRPPESA